MGKRANEEELKVDNGAGRLHPLYVQLCRGAAVTLPTWTRMDGTSLELVL